MLFVLFIYCVIASFEPMPRVLFYNELSVYSWMNCLSMLLLIYTVNTFYNHYACSCFIAAFKQFMPYVMLVIGVITHNTEIWLV